MRRRQATRSPAQDSISRRVRRRSASGYEPTLVKFFTVAAALLVNVHSQDWLGGDEVTVSPSSESPQSNRRQLVRWVSGFDWSSFQALLAALRDGPDRGSISKIKGAGVAAETQWGCDTTTMFFNIRGQDRVGRDEMKVALPKANRSAQIEGGQVAA